MWGLAFGCAPPGEPDAGPEPVVRLSRPLDTYRALDRITGSADFPAVAGVTTLAGPGDSTLLLFGLSLPTSALRFQREETGFAAEYVVALRAARDSLPAVRLDRREKVRVHGFAETARTEESVLFQTLMTLEPGEYTLSVRVRDGVSARGFEAIDTIAVPAYGPGAHTLAPPVPVYSASPRRDRSAEPTLVLNPRHTIAYGDSAPRVYLETYASAPVRLTLLDARGTAVWSREVRADGREPVDPVGRDVRPAAPSAGDPVGAVVVLPSDSLPMGRLTLVASAAGDTAPPVALVVTLTDQWVTSNFEEVMDVLGYIAADDELKALREASPEERRRLWEEFWRVRDPVPATPGNEYRDDFFERIRVATVRFEESGRPGWRTDRGEVYIILGPPTRLMELRLNDTFVTGRPRAEHWVYQRVPGGGRLELVFVDRHGFGTYRLSQESELEFRAVARRIKDRMHP